MKLIKKLIKYAILTVIPCIFILILASLFVAYVIFPFAGLSVALAVGTGVAIAIGIGNGFWIQYLIDKECGEE